MIRRYKGSALPQPDPLADEASRISELKKQLLEMDASRLTAYAAENGIDIGNATSQQGIYKKIIAHLEAVPSQ